MSEPRSSVTPKNFSLATPALPPCNVPYRWILHAGRCVSVYFDPQQPKAMWDEHQHSAVQILYFGPGSDCTIHWMQDGIWSTQHVHTSSVWIIGSGILHKVEWRKPALMLVLYVEPSFVAEFAGLEITGSFWFLIGAVERCNPRLAEFFRGFERLEQPRTQAEFIHVESLGSLASVHLCQAWSCLTRPADAWGTSLSDEALAKIDAFIESRIDQKILLVDLAREVGMSESNFARVFRGRVGVAPGRYLLDKRIQKAKTILATADFRIGEVALAVGFCSQGHFDLFFKRRVGMTPKEYRAAHRLRRDH